MPLADYIRPNGKTVELLVPSPIPDEMTIDGETCRRSPATRFAFVGTPKPALGQQILAGYYNEECKQGSRFHSRFKADHVKRAWANDKADSDEP